MGINYHVIQSKIAIGSGGIFGKGFGQGTQVQLGFLPEAQTDFIFAAIAEEGGLLAATILLASFFWMIFRIIKIGLLTEGNFNKFLCLGSAILFLIQFVLNVGSNLGVLPVIGVTLPFVSYGGSSMLASMILVGMIQSVWIRRI
jgi:rod shape determining protein RodA